MISWMEKERQIAEALAANNDRINGLAPRDGVSLSMKSDKMEIRRCWIKQDAKMLREMRLGEARLGS